MGPFYTYVIFISETPVYVGKGKDIRCFDHLYQRKSLMYQPLTIKVEWAKSAQEALERERELIQEYGIKGTLLNDKMNPHRRGPSRLRREVSKHDDLGPYIRWGMTGERLTGADEVRAVHAALDLLEDAEELLEGRDFGTPLWAEAVEAWFADHRFYEDQFDAWAEAFPTGYVRMVAARRRVERIVQDARKRCAGVSDAEYHRIIASVTAQHPWVALWDV